MPPIAIIQMSIGTAIVLVLIIKSVLARPKKKKEGEYLITNVHVIVGDGSELQNQNVYIKAGKIEKISDTPIKCKSAQIIDGTGKSLMPGLIDSHVHIQGINNTNEEESDKFLEERVPNIFMDNLLPFGVTTIKELGAPRHFIYKLRDKLNAGEIIGPELLVVGPNITGEEGHPAITLGGKNPWMRKEIAAEIDSEQAAHKIVEELSEAGVDFLKIVYQGGSYWYFDEELQIGKLQARYMEQIIREGQDKGLKTSAHVFYKEDVRELLNGNIYGIEHGILDESLDAKDDIIALWKEKGTYFVPTVNAMTYEKDENRMKHSVHNLKVLYDAGIKIAMGTDNMLETMTGETVHRELQYYVEAGLTPMQAIMVATKGSAEYLGIANRKGTVTVGKEADLILLDSNPLTDIKNIRTISKVFQKGKQVYPYVKSRAFAVPDYKYPEGKTEYCYLGTAVDESGVKEVQTIDVSGFAGEKQVVCKTQKDNVIAVQEELTLNDNLSATRWHYKREEDDTDLTAVLTDGMIHLEGSFKGKKQNKNLNLGDGLWYQLMDHSLVAFIKSDLTEIMYYSIGTGNNRGAMTLGEFASKKEGEETITVNGKSYDCIKISTVLTLFPMAWTGYAWYEKETGILVQSGEKGKKGSPDIKSVIR